MTSQSSLAYVPLFVIASYIQPIYVSTCSIALVYLPIFDLKSQDPKTLIATLTKDDDLNSLFDKLSEHGIKVKSMRNEQNRLEELFIRLVKEKDGN